MYYGWSRGSCSVAELFNKFVNEFVFNDYRVSGLFLLWQKTKPKPIWIKREFITDVINHSKQFLHFDPRTNCDPPSNFLFEASLRS